MFDLASHALEHTIPRTTKYKYLAAFSIVPSMSTRLQVKTYKISAQAEVNLGWVQPGVHVRATLNRKAMAEAINAGIVSEKCGMRCIWGRRKSNIPFTVRSIFAIYPPAQGILYTYSFVNEKNIRCEEIHVRFSPNGRYIFLRNEVHINNKRPLLIDSFCLVHTLCVCSLSFGHGSRDKPSINAVYKMVKKVSDNGLWTRVKLFVQLHVLWSLAQASGCDYMISGIMLWLRVYSRAWNVWGVPSYVIHVPFPKATDPYLSLKVCSYWKFGAQGEKPLRAKPVTLLSRPATKRNGDLPSGCTCANRHGSHSYTCIPNLCLTVHVHIAVCRLMGSLCARVCMCTCRLSFGHCLSHRECTLW